MSTVSHSPAIHLGCITHLLKSVVKSPKIFLLWAKQAQILQPLRTGPHTHSNHLTILVSLCLTSQVHLHPPYTGNPQTVDFFYKRKGKGARTLPIPITYFLGHAALQQ